MRCKHKIGAPTENSKSKTILFRVACSPVDGSYTSLITKPPEGLGVRLVSAGPLFFLRSLGLVLGVWGASCSTPTPARASIFAGVVVVPERRTVELDGRVACRRGWLEQVACARGTREHESLIVVDARPSQVQAALLAAGLKPGAPGRWEVGAGAALTRTPPSGAAIEVLVRAPPEAEPVPIDAWIRDARTEASTRLAFVFAGGRFAPGRQGGERFVTDDSGSVVGLVTFGDEVVALDEVVPDRVEVEPARWQARTAAMPEEGERVTLVLRARP
jgi:hypothetical protein